MKTPTNKSMKEIYDKSVEENIRNTAMLLHDKMLNAKTPTEQVDWFGDAKRELSQTLKTHTLSLIDAEIQRLEGMKKKIPTTVKVDEEMWKDIAKAFRIEERGYNQAIDDHLTHLKEQRELINKE